MASWEITRVFQSFVLKIRIEPMLGNYENSMTLLANAEELTKVDPNSEIFFINESDRLIMSEEAEKIYCLFAQTLIW